MATYMVGTKDGFFITSFESEEEAKSFVENQKENVKSNLQIIEISSIQIK